MRQWSVIWSPERRRECVDDALVEVELRVVDRGPGIPESDRERMFIPFQRLGDTDNTTGVGLGAARRAFNGGTPEAIHVRPWPQGEAIALISHTMKPEAEAALRAQYGYAHKLAMDSSIKLCVIAEGGADIYPRHGPTMEWDIAAGHAVLEAAGGSLLTPEGAPFAYGTAAEGFKNGWFVARGG